MIERLLSIFVADTRVRYRLSLLGSTALGWMFLLNRILTDGSGRESPAEMILILFMMGWILSSAFWGGLLLTAYRQGLVENNYPPSAEVANQVHLQHISTIGCPEKTLSASGLIFSSL
jgi:hypothetical protein